MKNIIQTALIRTRLEKIDWKLLFFLLLFLNFKLIIKLAAVIIIYLLRPDFKFGFAVKKSRLPFFYISMIVIAAVNMLIMRLVGNSNYLLVMVAGTFVWLLCILAIHQVKLAVEVNDTETLHRTIVIFFVINAVVSLCIYAGIIWETGAINPYRYQGNYQKYFIGTGDYIKGITFDTSTTNAVISALGVIYFLQQKKYGPVLWSMLVLLLTGSNLTNLLLSGCLMYIFLLQSNRQQKSMIVVCMLMLVVFLVKISPQNNRYITTAYQKLFNIHKPDKIENTPAIPIVERPDSALNDEERKQKFAQLYLDSINVAMAKKNTPKPLMAGISNDDPVARPLIPGDSIHTPRFQHKNDTSNVEEKLFQFIKNNTGELVITSGRSAKTILPGKLRAMEQTVHFFRQFPQKIITGNGMGNFSSKLAFRATSMNLTGSYPARYAYINEDFKQNHLDIYLFYFTAKDDYHSVMNSPNSVYDQLLGEYGLAGILSFLLLYIFFFVRQLGIRSVATAFILFMLGAFLIEYWFEQLSVVILFELLMFLIIKETDHKKEYAAA